MCIYICIFIDIDYAWLVHSHIFPCSFSWEGLEEMCVCSGAQLCPTLCDPMDCSLPGSSVHGIFQARTLEWVAISSSRRSSWSKDQTLVSWVSCTGRRILYHCVTWEARLRNSHIPIIPVVTRTSTTQSWFLILVFNKRNQESLAKQLLLRWGQGI